MEVAFMLKNLSRSVDFDSAPGPDELVGEG